MKLTIIFPCDFYHKNKVDSDYEAEYIQACKFNFNIIFFDYDEYIGNNRMKFYPYMPEEGLCIYRGWMLKPIQYSLLYDFLKNNGAELINSPEQYDYCHEFPNSYSTLSAITPAILTYSSAETIDWNTVRQTFDRFMVKDFVKSVKGNDFPLYFDNSYSDNQLDEYIQKFLELRGELYTGGIVLKQYADLAKYNGKTNEYRAFYLDHRLITLNCKSKCNPPDSRLSYNTSIKYRCQTVASWLTKRLVLIH